MKKVIFAEADMNQGTDKWKGGLISSKLMHFSMSVKK